MRRVGAIRYPVHIFSAFIPSRFRIIAAARRVQTPVFIRVRSAVMRLRIPVTELALKPGKTAVIVGAQWGDEGKGKIVDVLSESFSVVARYAGGHNAGHTVIINGKKFVLQLVPCGVLRTACRSVIGNGVVLDPMAFLKEVGALREAGVKGRRKSFCLQPRAGDSALPSHDRTGG